MKVTDSTNDQAIVIGAHRYYLGRRTIAVHGCIQWLRDHWPQLANNTQLTILRDTIAALMDDKAGDPGIDAPGWLAFARWGFDALGPVGQQWIRSALDYKWQEWPLSITAPKEGGLQS